MNNSEARKRLQDQVNAANNPVFPPDNHGVCPRCRKHTFIGHGPLCSECYGMTTHPAAMGDDTEALQRLLHLHYCGVSLDVPKPDHPENPATKCWAVARILTARHDALIAEAKAEAWNEGWAAVHRDHMGEVSNPYRAALTTGGEGRG